MHIHAGEQPREIEESLEEFGLRPIEHLDDCGLLGDRHDRRARDARAPRELDLLAETEPTVCACPTTEANLGDGFLPAAELWERGVPVSFGADSNVRLDPFEEARETEGCARRQSGRRNVLVADGDAGPAPSLWRCLTDHGARSLGLGRAGHRRGRARRPGRARPRAPRDPRRVAPEHLAAAVLFSGTGALVRETWVAGASAAALRRKNGVRPATCGSDPVLQVSTSGSGSGAGALLRLGDRADSAGRRLALRERDRAVGARRSARCEPADRDRRADVGAGGAGLAAGSAEAREADHDGAGGAGADQRAAGIALAGVAAALRDARAEHARGVVAVAVDLRAGAVGLDVDDGLAQRVGVVACGESPSSTPSRSRSRRRRPSRPRRRRVARRPLTGRASSSSARSFASVCGLKPGWTRTLTTWTRAGELLRSRSLPATMSSARRRGRTVPSTVTQCAAVITSRGETTTAPHV